MQKAVLICAIVAMASAQQPSPFVSFSSSPPFSNGPPSQLQLQGHPGLGRPPGPSYSIGGPPGSAYSAGGSPPPSFGGGPGSSFKRPNTPSKLFSWLGSTMSKLPGFQLPKIQYHKSKGPNSPPQNSPSYFSGPPNSLYDPSSSPFGGSTVSFAPHSNSVGHSPVNYRQPQGPPPPQFASRPPPSYSGRPSFSSRPPPSFGTRPPPFPSFGPSSSPFPGPSSSPYSGPSSSPYSGPGSSPYSGPGPNSSPFGSSQGLRENLEVFPSKQIAYQTQTLGQNQNQPSYEGNFGSELQNLYGSQSNKNPSYFPTQSKSPSFDPQSSFSQNSPYVLPDQSNYGATFHSFEPVSVAPIYDIGQNFKPSSSDLSQSSSNAQQSHANIHDKPFSAIMDEYAAQADAATSGSEKILSALSQSNDMATAASSNGLRGGMKILGQSTNSEGNPVFEVVADANAPMYDGHPVDLSKLISMIEPGAQIDTIPQFGEGNLGAASEQQPVYVQAPAGMTTDGVVSGNKKITGVAQNKRDGLIAAASESRPTILKIDGSKLSEDDDDKLIKEHFDKEIILDLQENSDNGRTNKSTNGTKSLYNDQLLAIVKQLRNANFQASAVESQSNQLTNDTSHHPHHNYNPPSSNSTATRPPIQAPVINPIVDSVEPSIGDSEVVDDDEAYPDDMFVETAGDLAASASNVKSVAIIVTPPPNYIKIKNKYTRWGRDMVSSTPAPTSQITSSVDDAFSESLVNSSKISSTSLLQNDSTLTNSTINSSKKYPIYRRKIN